MITTKISRETSEKALSAIKKRTDALGLSLSVNKDIPHEAGNLKEALGEATSDVILILTASATFEYTRYVCGPISNISKYRSGSGYNNLTVAELKEMVDSGVDITENKKEVISKGDEFIKSGDSVNNSKTINKKFQIGDGAGFI